MVFAAFIWTFFLRTFSRQLLHIFLMVDLILRSKIKLITGDLQTFLMWEDSSYSNESILHTELWVLVIIHHAKTMSPIRIFKFAFGVGCDCSIKDERR